MKINEDFLDDSRIEDLEQRDEITYEKSIEEFKWQLNIFIYAENELKQFERVSNKIENDIKRLADRCVTIADYSLSMCDNRSNKLIFDLYFDNNFKTLESFFRFVHPLTDMLWKSLNTIGKSNGDGHIDYTLYKNDNGDFRTYVDGEDFSDMCDDQMLGSCTSRINDIYLAAIKLFDRPQTYQTVIKYCSPNDYIVYLFQSSSERFKEINRIRNNRKYIVRCNCANGFIRDYAFRGSKFER